MSFFHALIRILKRVKIIDWLIFILGFFLIFRVDFSNVLLEDVIYLAALGMWFIMLVIRLYIEEKRYKK